MRQSAPKMFCQLAIGQRFTVDGIAYVKDSYTTAVLVQTAAIKPMAGNAIVFAGPVTP